MNAFDDGGLIAPIFFLCVAVSGAVAAATWMRLSSGRVGGAIGAALAALSLRAALVGGGTLVGVGVILMFAFPSAAPIVLGRMGVSLVLALACMALAGGATHLAFARVSTVRGAAWLTAATALFYVGVGVGLQRLNDHLLARAERQREARAAAAQARAQLAAITLDSRDEAVRKRVPLAPRTEPYASLYRCVAPLLAAREAAFRADGRWPDDRAAVAALAQQPACRVKAARALVHGGLEVTTEDDTLPPWGRQVAKKPEPFDPPPPPLELLFLPVADGDAAALRWLCTAPHQPHIATRFPGCGRWEPPAQERVGAR